jgi:hypothetical protein
VNQLFRPLETKVCAAQHQKRRDRLRQEVVQCKQRRQEEDKLVAHRPARDAPDDRQLAVGGKAVDVFRRDGGIVDHHPGGLGPGLGRGGGDVVNRGRCHLGDGRDVVQKGKQPAHALAPLCSGSYGSALVVYIA